MAVKSMDVGGQALVVAIARRPMHDRVDHMTVGANVRIRKARG